MDLTFGGLIALLKLTFQAPREAAAVLLRLPLPANARWAALCLLAVASALVMHTVSSLAPMAGPDGQMVQMPGPFFWAGMVGFGMVTTALLAHFIGRWRGGRGTLPDAVLLVAWLQVVQLSLVLVQIVLLVVLPPAAGLLEIASIAIFLWLLGNFVAELHGFKSVGMVVLAVLATFAVMVVVLTLLLFPILSAGM